MATLNAMLKLYRFSSTIGKINRLTNIAAKKVQKASSTTDKFNENIKAAGKIKDFTTAIGSKILKGISIADDFTNTNTRLSLINDGAQTQAELQDKIFAAADRSRGSYAIMANAISKMGLQAADVFGSNDELIAFTELLQKSIKLSGGSIAEQSSAFSQLSEAMAAGGLQGDIFANITENAPIVADAIAKYTGKSKSELAEMSAAGEITADIIKNAILMAGDDINAKFKTLPMTFGDVWTKIQNKGLEAFAPLIKKINELINTPGFKKFIYMIIGGIDLIGTGLSNILGFVQSNWSIIEPILVAIAGALTLWAFSLLPIMIKQLAIVAAKWLVMNWPILLIGAAIGLLIYAMIKFGDVTAKVFGYIGGAVGLLLACIYNAVTDVFNSIITLGDCIANTFIDLINVLIKGINYVLKKLNLIPGVKIELIGEIDRMNSEMFDPIKPLDAMRKGQEIGEKVGGSLSSAADKFLGKNPGIDGMGSYMQNGASLAINENGSAKLDIPEDNMKRMRDIAERDYVNKSSTIALAPNISISFGDVHEEADANKVAGRIQQILREEIAIAAEGGYA